MLLSTGIMLFVGGIASMAGLLMLRGRWTSAAATEARDPVRALRAEGVLLVVVGVLLVIRGVLFLALPEPHALAMAPWYSAGMLAITGGGLVLLLRARRR